MRVGVMGFGNFGLECKRIWLLLGFWLFVFELLISCVVL